MASDHHNAFTIPVGGNSPVGGLVLPLGTGDWLRFPRLPALPRAPTPPDHQGNPYERIRQLERDIRIMRESHSTLLAKLHEEVERLKNKNRDLQFKLIFNSAPESSGQEANQQNLEAEVKRLTLNLKDAQRKNYSLSSKLEHFKSSRHPDGFLNHIPSRAQSPKVEEYAETLRHIQAPLRRQEPKQGYPKLPRLLSLPSTASEVHRPFPILKPPLLPVVAADKTRKPSRKPSSPT